MSQTVKFIAILKSKQWKTAWALRLLGLLLLIVLLIRLDIDQLHQIISDANLLLVIASIFAVIPLIFVKTTRWQAILRSQAIRYHIWSAFLAYFGSLFIGFFTPGRLGEFVKAIHVNRDNEVSAAQAFSSVLADRLFDLYALLIVGGAALLTLTTANTEMIACIGLVLLLTIPLWLFINDTTFSWLEQFSLKAGTLGQKLLAPGSWFSEVRQGLRKLTLLSFLVSITLTASAYLIFFGQCYLLALALKLPISFVSVSYAVALGSLVTLLPISISGLGTREATIITYLGTVGISSEKALAFSLLVFVTFYIAGGLMGAVAWWIKPLSVKRVINYG